MLRPILLKHRENIDNRQSGYEAAVDQWEQERPGKEMETDNQFGGAGDEREREQKCRTVERMDFTEDAEEKAAAVPTHSFGITGPCACTLVVELQREGIFQADQRRPWIDLQVPGTTSASRGILRTWGTAHWSWDTRRGEELPKSKKKGPSCLGRNVVGMTL
ncbi:hypothetical protein SKAU_G00218960 [Synaphobranchus kaupii]|uniref:Uncharacterized protein n=1 Tax=Synaphobranchus kaupii TaxID=118154 RepID=A0A9Q1FAC8_SYNKA|nr:hypothetical protein SKAU_G00218960 [Synaphobranchus kaupii]